MTYELCKKLKDAGFPIRNNPFSKYDVLEPEYIIPTLSELIEACGKDFMELTQTKFNHWNANVFTLSKDGIHIFGGGDTPEEAVATLWLELNKK